MIQLSEDIIEKINAGIALTGPETKSAKAGSISLKGSFVAIKSEEAFLINAHISPYKPASGAQKNYDPTRSRKLLLKKNEIKALIGKIQRQGLTAMPLKVYTSPSGFVKIEVALGRGKKIHEKKDALKKRVVEREMRNKIKEQP